MSTQSESPQTAAPAMPAASPRRGTLRIYLGAAPGVGKTFAMLNEARRRKERGTDVVIGYVETHGRAHTAEQMGDLEVVPRKVISYRGAALEEMDLDAVLARRPAVAIVDELAHTNVPGSKHAKRWEDVDELLDAGIDVISTVNIQHLESINDVVERITGVRQRETLPDQIVRAADQIELVDMTPEALRRRLAHGNIYAPEKIDAALTNYFRPGNLAALRELALLWVADRVDDALEEYRERHGITQPWETRERVVVAITGAPSTDALVRRAARIAQRAHGELLGVHVRSDDGLVGSGDTVEHQRRLLEEMGGTYHETAGNDIAAALVEFARAENATQLVLGASRRSRWAELTRGSVINRVVRLARPIDVHVISQESAAEEDGERVVPRMRRRVRLSPRRRLLAWLTAVAGIPALTAVLVPMRDDVGLPTILLLYLVLVVVVAALGGVVPAMVSALAAFLVVNRLFTPPIHTWTIAEAENLVALVVFLIVAGVVSAFVSAAARRTAEATRAAAEAETLAGLAGTMAEPDPLPVLVDNLRRAFGLGGVALLRRAGDESWQVEAMAGDAAPRTPDEADEVRPLGADLVLAVRGSDLAAEDQRVLNAFVAQLAAAIDRRRIGAQAARATALAEANELRSALLQAVSHDLRTPLAGIKASASSLRQLDIAWSDVDRNEFLRTIEDETDRLTTLVGNLLDMSRIQAGAVAPRARPVGLEEVVPAALAGLGERADKVDVDVPESLPPVRADPALLERVVANLVDNAVAHSVDGSPVRIEAGEVGSKVMIRVIDRGPGIPPAERERIFQPFQRLGDSPSHGAGVGLGLAVALGFTRAMGGDLVVDDTPGGGTTMTIELEVAA
ncbi:MAG TPA: ATP-binding protein [Acidimicrobiales bacterium]|nr:ATP-binding protein [Acidimicrobiales bacterium]